MLNIVPNMNNNFIHNCDPRDACCRHNWLYIIWKDRLYSHFLLAGRIIRKPSTINVLTELLHFSVPDWFEADSSVKAIIYSFNSRTWCYLSLLELYLLFCIYQILFSNFIYLCLQIYAGIINMYPYNLLLKAPGYVLIKKLTQTIHHSIFNDNSRTKRSWPYWN